MSEKTVIFDMDGTLLDTEKYYRICWKAALKKYGFIMTDEQALSMRSLGRPFAPQHLKEMFGEELDYHEVRNYRKQLMEEYLERDGITVKPGAEELLAWLKEHKIATAVATATDMERTERYLIKTGLYDYMDSIVSAVMVSEGKPSPDIYLYACEQLCVRPENTFAVEDSPNGVLSAYRAGCNVIMVPDQTQPDEELKKCLYACVPTLNDIKQIIV